METIIKHLMEITGHRDHDLLNISVISALCELTHSEQARVLAIVQIGKKISVQTQITFNSGTVAVADNESPDAIAGDPISKYPALEQGIINRDHVIKSKVGNKLVIWLPIWINEKVNTCLEITNPMTYTDNSMEVIEGLMVVYRNFQNLLDYSERDSLTGLLNRKTFDDNFSKILRATTLSAAAAQPVTNDRRQAEPPPQNWLAVLDIDHFKRVNDQFGHLYGDEVLILVANLLRSSFRPSDRLFRFGGEEFVILLRSTSQADAQMIFDRFRKNVEEYNFPQVGRVTISIGYARIDPYEASVGIMGRADQALYFSKANGRNRCCYYDDLVQSGDLHAEVANDTAEFF
jgi:diguanylate cyclase (GGDEF)-like protein